MKNAANHTHKDAVQHVKNQSLTGDIRKAVGSRFVIIIAVLLLFWISGLKAETYYIARNGDDTNSGTIDEPFATFEQAISLVQPGDTIYVRGGTYLLDTNIAIDKAGTENAPICLWAYPDELPVIDFGNNPRHANPPQPRDDDSIEATSDALGIFVAPGCEWWHIKGLILQDAPYYGVRVYGSNNIFELLVLRDHQASGLEITGKEGHVPSYNLVLNCDSYLNFDPQTNGEDADGFAAKFESLGPGNVFSGLRAWSNSDDGYDFWHATHPVLLENCWSFDNGFFRPEWEPEVNGSWRGDGLGFKLGQDASELILHRVVAFGNKAYGIHDNGNNSQDGVNIYNATLVNNAKNGNPVQIQLNDGSPHTVRNTIAFDVDGPGVTILHNAVDDTYNSWNGIGVSGDDFLDINMDTLYATATSARTTGGNMPDIGLQLTPGSDLIDAGIDVGLPFYGAAPDLGAFETTAVSLPEHNSETHRSGIHVKVSPNPFSHKTNIFLELASAGELSMCIYDLRGNLMEELSSNYYPSGLHHLTWRVNDRGEFLVPHGLYILEIHYKGKEIRKKLVVVR